MLFSKRKTVEKISNIFKSSQEPIFMFANPDNVYGIEFKRGNTFQKIH